jgi:hypothetical protein
MALFRSQSFRPEDTTALPLYLSQVQVHYPIARSTSTLNIHIEQSAAAQRLPGLSDGLPAPELRHPPGPLAPGVGRSGPAPGLTVAGPGPGWRDRGRSNRVRWGKRPGAPTASARRKVGR